MKHTPEPWILREGGRLEPEFVVTTEGRDEDSLVSICSGDWEFYGTIGTEQKANANKVSILLDQRDELLAALKVCRDQLTGRNPISYAQHLHFIDGVKLLIAKYESQHHE